MGELYMMNKLGKILLIYFFSIVMFISTIGTITVADPVVGDIILSPDKPAPQSVVTLSADISGDSISSVRIIVRECNKETGICYAPPQNVSMIKNDGNAYAADVTLLHDDVTSITYNVLIRSNGRWIKYEEHTSPLSANSGNSEMNGNDSNNTPGFEIVVFLMALIGSILLFKRAKK